MQSERLYLIAWGIECEAWHDTIDWTVLAGYDFGDIPDDNCVMAPWHDKEPLAEVLGLRATAHHTRTSTLKKR